MQYIKVNFQQSVCVLQDVSGLHEVQTFERVSLQATEASQLLNNDAINSKYNLTCLSENIANH